MDLEEETYKRLGRMRDEDLIAFLAAMSGSDKAAKAILDEAKAVAIIPDEQVSRVCAVPPTRYKAGNAGLGCRGRGDFLIHKAIAMVIGRTGATVDAMDQDDAGVVEAWNGRYVAMAVDGMHSRLSRFPFLAGFHVARAAVRDVIVMGARPVGMMADLHIGNDGDISRVLDFTAGAALVGETTGVPLVSGSTLRIGGDLVLGERITGCVGAVGVSDRPLPRRDIKPGDVLLMTQGAGGGTVTTTALFNGRHNVVLRTLEVKTLMAAMAFIEKGPIEEVHAMTDVTNGGIRGDAFEMSSTAGVKVHIFREPFEGLIDAEVLAMFKALDIDPLGVSIDSFLMAMPEEEVKEVLTFFKRRGIMTAVVGRAEEDPEQAKGQRRGKAKGRGKWMGKGKSLGGKGNGLATRGGFVTLRAHAGSPDDEAEEMEPLFREAPYTPIKRVASEVQVDLTELDEALEKGVEEAKRKMVFVRRLLR